MVAGEGSTSYTEAQEGAKLLRRKVWLCVCGRGPASMAVVARNHHPSHKLLSQRTAMFDPMTITAAIGFRLSVLSSPQLFQH